jgi:hypothetical protein
MSTLWRPSPAFPTQYGRSADELKDNKRCQREHQADWVVLQRKCNHSAFNGYHWTPSDYSSVRCGHPGCGRVWRTKAAYVDSLPDAKGEGPVTKGGAQ